jgi:hypothetical protein
MRGTSGKVPSARRGARLSRAESAKCGGTYRRRSGGTGAISRVWWRSDIRRFPGPAPAPTLYTESTRTTRYCGPCSACAALGTADRSCTCTPPPLGYGCPCASPRIPSQTNGAIIINVGASIQDTSIASAICTLLITLYHIKSEKWTSPDVPTVVRLFTILFVQSLPCKWGRSRARFPVTWSSETASPGCVHSEKRRARDVEISEKSQLPLVEQMKVHWLLRDLSRSSSRWNNKAATRK